MRVRILPMLTIRQRGAILSQMSRTKALFLGIFLVLLSSRLLSANTVIPCNGAIISIDKLRGKVLGAFEPESLKDAELSFAANGSVRIDYTQCSRDGVLSKMVAWDDGGHVISSATAITEASKFPLHVEKGLRQREPRQLMLMSSGDTALQMAGCSVQGDAKFGLELVCPVKKSSGENARSAVRIPWEQDYAVYVSSEVIFVHDFNYLEFFQRDIGRRFHVSQVARHGDYAGDGFTLCLYEGDGEIIIVAPTGLARYSLESLDGWRIRYRSTSRHSCPKVFDLGDTLIVGPVTPFSASPTGAIEQP